MSSDWEYAPLGEVCSRITYGFTNPMPTVDGDGAYMVTAKDIKNGRIQYQTARKTSWDAYRSNLTDKSRPAKGDLLLTKDGSIGRLALCDRDDICINQSVALLQSNGKGDFRYIKYLLEAPEYQRKMESDSDGSTIKHIYITRVDKMIIPLPPRKEQQGIVSILGTLDDKIELNRKTNETLEAMAKALFKSWFVDFDPVRAKAEGRPTGLPAEISDLFPDSFEDSELGETPRGWEPRAIREWGRTECGKTPSTHNQEFYGSDYMFVTIPDLHNGFQIVTSGKQLSELGADSQRKKLLPPGSVMVSCIATPGLVGVAKEACFTNQQINSIIPSSKEASWFLALAMIENRDLLLSLGGSGSVFFNLSKGRFDEIEILAPSEDLISAFSGVVSALMDRCFATKQEIIALTDVRDALLPKLISGEIRIPDAEKLLEEAGI